MAESTGRATGSETRYAFGMHGLDYEISELRKRRLPRPLKIVYTLFLIILVPAYWQHYGLANFLWGSDIALILLLVAILFETSLPAIGPPPSVHDLDERLDSIRKNLEAFAEDPSQNGALTNVQHELERLHLTFQTMAQQGARILTDEMMAVGSHMLHNGNADCNDSLNALTDAVIVLPSYLDRLQAGHEDLPILLLPTLNELRATQLCSPNFGYKHFLKLLMKHLDLRESLKLMQNVENYSI